MRNIEYKINEIHTLDALSARDQWVNKIHPLVKFLLTILYISTVVSFTKYDLIGLMGMFIYPVLFFVLADLSFTDCIKRLWLALSIICFIGILNPFLDVTPIYMDRFYIRGGVISMITLILKGVFTILSSYLFIATTSIEKICFALEALHCPKIISTEIMLVYRYLFLLLEEVHCTMQAYALRAPKQKGIHFKVWGTLTGHILLRSIDRANTVYESMTLRGYHDNVSYLKTKHVWKKSDIIILFLGITMIILLRKYPIVILVGNFFV